jgi:hypothetical protein
MLIAAFTGALTIAVAAQQPSVAGTWTVKGEAASGQNDSGGTWNRSAVTGTLVIAEKDGALTGTWTPTRRPPLTFTGQLKGDAFDAPDAMDVCWRPRGWTAARDDEPRQSGRPTSPAAAVHRQTREVVRIFLSATRNGTPSADLDDRVLGAQPSQCRHAFVAGGQRVRAQDIHLAAHRDLVPEVFEVNGGFDVFVRPEYGGAFTADRDPGVVIRRAPCDIGQQIPRGVQVP